jgi:uncharacterized protein Smg (DUF494 family)
MMNLFSLIADQVRNKQELFDHEGRIMQTLLNDGYHLHEADAALTLMQTLVRRQDEGFFGSEQTGYPVGMRTMNSEERNRFETEAFAFAVKLTHLGVLSEDQREEVLERAMNLYRERVDLHHMKSLVTFMLFTSTQERDDPSSFRRVMKRTAWN